MVTGWKELCCVDPVLLELWRKESEEVKDSETKYELNPNPHCNCLVLLEAAIHQWSKFVTAIALTMEASHRSFDIVMVVFTITGLTKALALMWLSITSFAIAQVSLQTPQRVSGF